MSGLKICGVNKMNARKGRLWWKNNRGIGRWLKRYFLKKTCRKKYDKYRKGNDERD